MLRWRLLLAPFLIAGLAGVFWADWTFGPSSPLLLVFGIGLVARATWELMGLLKTRSFAPNGWLVFLTSSATLAVNWTRWPQPLAEGTAATTSTLDVTHHLAHVAPSLLMLVASGMFLFTFRALRYRTPGANLETLAAEWLCTFYLGGLLTLIAQLRWMRPEWGYLPLASVVVVAKVCDIAAFTAGKIIGGPKLIPLLSPGKTWAGAIGGVVGAALGSWGLFAAVGPWLSSTAHVSVERSLLYGALVGLLGEVGDLCESLIKRDVGQKDSAPMLPGFGGLLDLLDSVLFAGAAAYALWLVAPPVTA